MTKSERERMIKRLEAKFSEDEVSIVGFYKVIHSCEQEVVLALRSARRRWKRKGERKCRQKQ
jgi:hypothetical protein